MPRMEQVNELLRSEIARLISPVLELPDILITVLYVKCSSDLREATVGISVLPENRSGTALQKLKNKNAQIRASLMKRLTLKFTPRLRWRIDAVERHAAEMDKVFNELD